MLNATMKADLCAAYLTCGVEAASELARANGLTAPAGGAFPSPPQPGRIRPTLPGATDFFPAAQNRSFPLIRPPPQ